VRKARRIPRKPQKTQRRKIARAEWDFKRVGDEDLNWVCVREYCKECLRAWDEGRLDSMLMMTETLAAGPEKRDVSELMAAIRRGIEARAEMKRPGRKQTIPVVQEIPPEYGVRPPLRPAGTYVVCLQINWRASNNDIKAALGDWLEKHVKCGAVRSTASDAYLDNMLEMLLQPEGEPLRDYDDLAAAYFKYVNTASLAGPERNYPTRFVIKELRRGVGPKRGRGGGKRAMLDDLAVARLHWAGRTPAEIGKHLGAAVPKSSILSQIRRAAWRVEDRLSGMITAAETFESGMQIFKRKKSSQ
jgi:hypothetical protein